MKTKSRTCSKIQLKLCDKMIRDSRELFSEVYDEWLTLMGPLDMSDEAFGNRIEFEQTVDDLVVVCTSTFRQMGDDCGEI